MAAWSDHEHRASFVSGSAAAARVLSHRLALDVACPECGARAGEICVRTRGSQSVGRSHQRRWRTAHAVNRNKP